MPDPERDSGRVQREESRTSILYGRAFDWEGVRAPLLPFLIGLSRETIRRLCYTAMAGRRGDVGCKLGRAHAGKTSSGDAYEIFALAKVPQNGFVRIRPNR
jgi:hypothetical protein